MKGTSRGHRLFPPFTDLHEAIRFDSQNGNIWLEEQRMLLLHAAALGSMRQELIRSLGEDYTRGLLMRMGSTSGRTDAQFAARLRAGAPLKDIFSVGPQLHCVEGIVNVEPVALDLGEKSGHFYGEYVWRNSFEAAEHLRLFGPSEEPVCWQMLGYACGYTTQIIGRPVYFREVECVGKGDPCCRIIGKNAEDWENPEEFKALTAAESLSDQLESLRREVKTLRSVIGVAEKDEKIIADSPAIREALYMLTRAAETDVTVLMLGETGVGKDVFSRRLHDTGARRDGPFVAVNCAALPRELVESELFGVEKGAYTGADKARAGRFEVADGGTLFLDELGELNERAQAKLLRVLQTGTFERVGSTRTVSVNVRLIAATNADLQQRVRDGSFRADLYYRLNVFPITIPPLRERVGDLPGLVEKFIERHNKKYGKSVSGLTDEAMHRLIAYDWPGNVRELENIIERGVILTENGGAVPASHISVGDAMSAPKFGPVKGGCLVQGHDHSYANRLIEDMLARGGSMEALEKDILKAALDASKGNVEAAARKLGMTGPQCR
ncbi:MAG: sigma 54-interacting transcriptional regulator, partial [Gammaproteobacteria bacterium]|nr:sigma 54-interacting transcriptional regulator [Gammaproteobacteria bacterium]